MILDRLLYFLTFVFSESQRTDHLLFVSMVENRWIHILVNKQRCDFKIDQLRKDEVLSGLLSSADRDTTDQKRSKRT